MKNSHLLGIFLYKSRKIYIVSPKNRHWFYYCPKSPTMNNKILFFHLSCSSFHWNHTHLHSCASGPDTLRWSEHQARNRNRQHRASPTKTLCQLEKEAEIRWRVSGGKAFTLLTLLLKLKQFLTGQRVDSNGGAHFLELNPELWAFSDLLFVFAGKLLQVRLERLQLFRHLEEKNIKS